LLAPALVAVAFLVLPLIGLLIRAPWGHLGAALSGSDATQALALSVWTATTATAISLVIGVPLAWVLARTSFPGQRLLRALVALPLVLPPVVGGVALLLAFGRTGFAGRLLDSWFGLTIPFTPIAVVMAETFVAMPFLVITVEGALRSADQGFEEAAATLGAKRMTVFRRVTRSKTTRTRRSRSAWCCWWSPSWSWSLCAITGCVAARSHDARGRRPRR
jgi:molybdate transport system permease protein